MPEPRKPAWLKVRLPGGGRYAAVRKAVASRRLHTVCESARCPNQAECWGLGTATFLILGGTCTRGCRFCAVPRAERGTDAPDEPGQVAAAAREMGLGYVVVTSVTRDDLPDGGASVFADTVARLRRLDPPPLVELLIPDYLGEALEAVVAARPDVLAHNVEVVERLTPLLRHGRFRYRRSLEVLRRARELAPGLVTKSSIMLGLGETPGEVEQAMEDLRAAGVEILVLGQYLRPTRAQAPVVEYVPPERFGELAERARRMGFGFVAAGPLVRTSYRAAEAHVRRSRVSDREARCPTSPST